jgi:hypothetical protein
MEIPEIVWQEVVQLARTNHTRRKREIFAFTPPPPTPRGVRTPDENGNFEPLLSLRTLVPLHLYLGSLRWKTNSKGHTRLPTRCFCAIDSNAPPAGNVRTTPTSCTDPHRVQTADPKQRGRPRSVPRKPNTFLRGFFHFPVLTMSLIVCPAITGVRQQGSGQG